MKSVATQTARSAFWLTLLAIGLAAVPTGAQPADSGEFQLVARDLGVAHPPGYPLYTMAAHLFGRLVLAASADFGWPWAVNAFSMVLAVATLAVVARTAARVGGTWVAGAVAAVLLAFSPTFAAQALVANIRMGTGLFTAVVLGLALSWLGERGSNPPTAYGPLPATEDSPHPPTPSPKAGGGGVSRVGGNRTLVALCFVGALAAGHHPTLAALALPLGIAIIARRRAVLRDARLIAQCLAAALVGLLPLAYLPIRAAQGAPLAPRDLATIGGVWRHVTAAGFRGDMLAITGARDLGDRLLVLANILQLQFTPLALALIAIGTIWLLARRRAEAVALLGTALIVSWLAITYRAPQTMEYLLPAYIALAIIAGTAAGVLLRLLRFLPLPQHWGRGSGGEGLRPPAPARLADRTMPLATATLILAATFAFALPMRGRAPLLARTAVPDLSSVTRLATDPDCLPASTTVLASWHYVTPLWLMGRRSPADAGSRADTPYVTASGAPIVYVHPDFATGDPIGETWRTQVTAAAVGGSTVATNRPREVIDADIALEGLSGTPFWLHRPGSLPRLRCVTDDRYPGLRNADFETAEESWQLVEGDIEPGPVGLDIYLVIMSYEKRPSDGVVAFAQLVDLDAGVVAGQADRPLGDEALGDDAGMSAYVVRLPLAPFRGIDLSHRLAADVGLYRMTPDGPQRLAIGSVRYFVGDSLRSPNLLRPADSGVIVDGTAARLWIVDEALVRAIAKAAGPPAEAPAIPFANALSLLHSTVHRTPTALVVDLTWQADARAFASDYTVSVQAAAADASWRAQHDGTPALGAIPTLKWLPGMIIRDRHRIPLPPEAAGHAGPYTVTVGVYDAFSLEPLPVTDGELVRQGQGQRAVVFESP